MEGNRSGSTPIEMNPDPLGTGVQIVFEWSGPGSNRQPPRCDRGALPIELPPLEVLTSGVGNYMEKPLL